MNKSHGLAISRHHPFHPGSNPGFGWKKKEIWEKQIRRTVLLYPFSLLDNKTFYIITELIALPPPL